MYYYHPGAYTFASHPPPQLVLPPPTSPVRARTQSQPLLSPTLRNFGHRQTASVSRLDVTRLNAPRSAPLLSPPLLPSEAPVAHAANRKNKARSLSLFLCNPADPVPAPRQSSPPLPPLPHEVRTSWVGYSREQQRRSTSFSRPAPVPTTYKLPPIPPARRHTLDPARHQHVQHLPHDLQVLQSSYLPTPSEVYSIHGELYEEQIKADMATIPLPTGIAPLGPQAEMEYGGHKSISSTTRSDRDQSRRSSSRGSRQRGRDSVGSSNTFGGNNDGVHQLLPSALPSTLPSPRVRQTSNSTSSLSSLSLLSSAASFAPVKTYQNHPQLAKDGNIGHDPDYDLDRDRDHDPDHPNNSCKQHFAQAHRTPNLHSNENNTIQLSSPGCPSQLPLVPERTEASFETAAGLPMHDTTTRTRTTATPTTAATAATTTATTTVATTRKVGGAAVSVASSSDHLPVLSPMAPSPSFGLTSSPEALAAAPKATATHCARALDGHENECTPNLLPLLQSLPLALNETRNEIRTLQQQIQLTTKVLMHVVQRRATPDAECLRALASPPETKQGLEEKGDHCHVQESRSESDDGNSGVKEPMLTLFAVLYCQDPWEYQARVIRQLEFLQQRLFEAEKSEAWKMRRETVELERRQAKSQQNRQALQWSNTFKVMLGRMVQESILDDNGDAIGGGDEIIDEGIEVGDHEAELESACEENPKSQVKGIIASRDDKNPRERGHIDNDIDNHDDDREEVSLAKRTMFQRTFGIRVRPFVAKDKRGGEER